MMHLASSQATTFAPSKGKNSTKLLEISIHAKGIKQMLFFIPFEFFSKKINHHTQKKAALFSQNYTSAKKVYGKTKQNRPVLP